MKHRLVGSSDRCGVGLEPDLEARLYRFRPTLGLYVDVDKTLQFITPSQLNTSLCGPQSDAESR